MNIKLIVAVSNKNGIGKDNKIPWNSSKDIRFFRDVTQKAPRGKQNVVIMGSNTWKSIDLPFRPLKKRYNIVLSRNKKFDSHYVATSIEDALEHCKTLSNVHNIYFIGGKRVYDEGFSYCDELIITYVSGKYDCDTFFPRIPNNYEVDVSRIPPMVRDIDKFTGKDITLQTVIYKRTKKRHEEYQYLENINKILRTGEIRDDRTGVGVKSLFGLQMRFDISKSFPLLTTKRTYLKGIIHELLWFLRGETDTKLLRDKGVHIWDGNSSREFLDNLGFTEREEGDGGPIYGFNFRHFGGNYKDCHTDYTGEGVDQVKYVLDLIKNNPTSRRILINLWNPVVLEDMCLPPCHLLYQFFVSNGKLSCSMYQRSGDMGLGVPFNIASASLMTYIFAKLTDLKPGELIHTIGDAHIYTNHFEGLEKQIKREPRVFPVMTINPDKKYEKVEDFEYEDFKITGYDPHPRIKMEMAV